MKQIARIAGEAGARKLEDAGFRTIEEVGDAPVDELKKIFDEEVAKKIKNRAIVLSRKREVQKKPEKPKFRRYLSYKIKRLDPAWRRPRGRHSKLRSRITAKGPKVQIGYRRPEKVRGIHPSGYREKLVHSPDDLDGVENDEAIRIAHGVGMKKRLAIQQKASELGIKVLNPRGE
jgi:large subunit ribosomal protein L32e